MGMDAWAASGLVYEADRFLRSMFSSDKAANAFLEMQKARMPELEKAAVNEIERNKERKEEYEAAMETYNKHKDCPDTKAAIEAARKKCAEADWQDQEANNEAHRLNQLVREPYLEQATWAEAELNSLKDVLGKIESGELASADMVMTLLEEDAAHLADMLGEFFRKHFPELPELRTIGYADERWRRSENAIPYGEYYMEFESEGLFQETLTSDGEKAAAALEAVGIDRDYFTESTWVIISS